MIRCSLLVTVGLCLATCARVNAPTIPPTATAEADLVTARLALAERGPQLRATAAARIRVALATGQTLPGDHGEAHWRVLLSSLRPEITRAEFAAATGASASAMGPGLISFGWQLDDAWHVMTTFNEHDRMQEIGPLERHLRSVWVEPPAGFTGPWINYFANGIPAHAIEYVEGAYSEFVAYHDNGQLAVQQHYISGIIHGAEIGYHRNGVKAYEGAYVAGRQRGAWRHWFPSGQPQSELSYIAGAMHGRSTTWREDGTRVVVFDYTHGEETGQAAWDEHGTLLYSRGTTADVAP